MLQWMIEFCVEWVDYCMVSRHGFQWLHTTNNFPMKKAEDDILADQTKTVCLLVVKVGLCSMRWNLCLITAGYKVIWISNFIFFFRYVISVIGRETRYQSVPKNCIWPIGGHTSGMKLKYRDMGTSSVNRCFDDLEICFNLSTPF